MTQRFMLSDGAATLLIILGAIAAAVYIIASINDIRDYLHDRRISEFKLAVERNKTSPIIAEYYRAAADGDQEDNEYWEETAEMFDAKKSV